MELAGMENSPEQLLSNIIREIGRDESVPTPFEVVSILDKLWYSRVSGQARWMDLVGDFAGTERFVVDGDALVEAILDDPLLALARDDDPSFQMLHARWASEKWLQNMLDRDAVFDVVFWHDNRHFPILTGQSNFKLSSRSLARRLLFQHLLNLHKIDVHVFKSLDDPEWLHYVNITRPMFVMTNDGGRLETKNEALRHERLLLQRIFIFQLLSSGLYVVLLKDAEFCDHKILCFVLEENRVKKAVERIPGRAKKCIASVRELLETTAATTLGQSLPILSVVGEKSFEDSVSTFCRRLSSGTDPSFETLLQCFVAHVLVLKRVDISHRALPLPALSDELVKQINGEFYPRIFRELEHAVCDTGFAFDLDGRVFATIVYLMSRDERPTLANIVGNSIASTVQALLKSTASSTALRKSSKPSRDASNAQNDSLEAFTVLPFSNPVFDEELRDVHITATGKDVQLTSTKGRYFDYGNGIQANDDRHWHSPRSILPGHQGGDTSVKLDSWQIQRRLKRQQREMARMQRHAVTLTGALGVPLQPTVIVSARGADTAKKKIQPDDEPPNSVSNQKQGKGGKTQKGKKAEPQKSSADKLREKIAAEKRAKQVDEMAEWWSDKLKEHSDLPSAKQRAIQTEALFRNRRTEDGWLALEIRLYRVHLEFLVWIEDPSKETAAANDQYTVSILRLVKSLCERKTLSQVILDHVEMILHILGFSDYFAKLSSAVSISKDKTIDRKLSFKFVKLLKGKTDTLTYEYMRIREAPILWQLRLFGEYMDRSMDSKPDKRVSFEPDGWQRTVLDCLDERKSVLVVAPTSAGKTFISFYAMEQVLRESDEGVLVYVAPTKALVNQIAAEVYARFQKTLPGGSCWAVHTRDNRINNPQKCQILVTVPEMFAIMLLSPPLARLWTPRIRWIILDEIHSIGQQEGGAVWEQIILFAPCPIIGLSATVGHPEKFNEWLESVQRAHNVKHEFVYHPHRYSHLRKHIFVQHDDPYEFEGLKTYEPSGKLHFLHPISLIAPGTPLPSDFSLEARDTLTLYQALVKSRKRLPDYVDMDRLDPQRFFPTDQLLRQQDILEYEAELKNVVVGLMSDEKGGDLDPNSESALREVMKLVKGPELSSVPSDDLYITPSRDSYFNGLMCLLVELHKKDCLPALLFSFDRSNCEEMATVILKELEEAEGRWKDTSPEWRARLSQWKSWQDRKHRRQQTEDKVKKPLKKGHDEERDTAGPPQPDPDDIKWASFDPDDPLPDFSFANYAKYQKSELLKDIDDLKWTSTPSWAIKALRRGVGVHHAGMSKGYRTTIESLFRLGYIRVLFATGTLALGINAPTKTAVFCGDSPYLTALTYRQCAGRAGRRGYDLLGNVVFYGIPMDRIQRLVLSRLPSLSGNFPLTSTLTARLFGLLHGSNNSNYSIYAIRSITRLPQVSFGSKTGRDQLLHHLRFSIEYLRRSGILDINGRPLNLHNVASHLYYTEPSNLALIALIRGGVLHRICKKNMTDAKDELMSLFCHLFGRRHLPLAYTSKVVMAGLLKAYPSRIVLGPLNSDAQEVLRAHNVDVLSVFSAYSRLFSTQHRDKLGDDNVLPLSKGIIKPGPTRDEHPSRLQEYLQRHRVNVSSRSLFVANSGLSDQCESVEELVWTCREGLHLNARAIPSFGGILASTGGRTDVPRLNAYILDFYKHGQIATLSRANGIRKGDIWYILNDFLLSLLSVRNALQELLRTAESSEEDETEDGTGDAGEAEDLELTSFPRPVGVNDDDWRVYEVLDRLVVEFNDKFKKMWA